MKRNHQTFDEFLQESLKNPKIRKEFNRLQPEYAVIDAVLKARKDKGMTQKQLATKIGTKQSVISRLEAGRANPSVAFLAKLANALGTRLEIHFRA